MYFFWLLRCITLVSIHVLFVHAWSSSVHSSYTKRLHNALLQRANMSRNEPVKSRPVVVPALQRVIGNHQLISDDHQVVPERAFSLSAKSFSFIAESSVISVSQKSRSLVILIPYILKHASYVVASLSHWSNAGDPCPFLRKNHIKKVDLAFWFNKDFDTESKEFRASFKRDIEEALGNNSACFGEVKYLSAHLKPEEDKYPLGPSYQWYYSFLSNTTGLKGHYEYMFWQEHDVHPIREGFIDKLFEEVTFDGDFYAKGSIHRGMVLTGKSRGCYEFIEHINGNALYNFHDESFIALIGEILELSVTNNGGGYGFSMDISLWIFAVSNYKRIWPRYQRFAHKFVHSDFIQAYSHDVPLNDLNNIMVNMTNTFLIHGDGQSTGRKKYHIRKHFSTGNESTILPAPNNALLPRLSRSMSDLNMVSLISVKNDTSLLIVVPFVEKEISTVLAALGYWTLVGDACPFILKHNMKSVHLEFWMNAPMVDFPDKLRMWLGTALGNSSDCFGEVRYRVDQRMCPNKANAIRRSFQFYNVFQHFQGRYDYMFWSEPHVFPTRTGFIDILLQEAAFSNGFYMKGSINRGSRMDPNIEKAKGDSCRINMNALYNLKDREFRTWIQQKVYGSGVVPMYATDVLIQRNLKDYSKNWGYLQKNVHKYVYSEFILPYGEALNASDINIIMANAPNSFWIQAYPEL